MIDARVFWLSTRGALPALLLVLLLSAPAWAGPGRPPVAKTLGADSVGQRARERGRMQAEYDVMKDERRLALAEARESVAGAVSKEDESARNSATIRMLAGSREGSDGSAAGEGDVDGASTSGEAGSGFRNVMICAIFVMLSTAVYLRFRTNGARRK